MSTKAVADSEKHSHDHSVVIDIYNKLAKNDDDVVVYANSPEICICRVPRSLSSGKPEAFTPHFVGLGPYHHFRENLTIITDELKLAAAKRELKELFIVKQSHKNHVTVTDIQTFFHADVNSTWEKDYTLGDVLTIDGLFLLALLFWWSRDKSLQGPHFSSARERTHRYSYFLTGTRGMPLVNADGVELTMDAINSDVFMLENQIPTHVLINHVSHDNTDETQSEEQVAKDLAPKMLTFCKDLCPLNKTEELRQRPHEFDHLLDLMYHLVAPKEPEESEQPKPKPKPDSKPRGKGKEEKGQNNKESRKICFNILVFGAILCMLLGLIIKVIWKLITRVLSGLVKILPKFVDLCDKPPISEVNFLKPIAAIGIQLKQTSERVQMELSTNWDKGTRPAVTIPSVTQLHRAGIQFQPATGGISTIHFNEETSQFYLPEMKLGVNSEVIIRNLVAYESLIRPTYLIFTRYIEIMSAIIKTDEDVKLLEHKKIIKTGLSDDVIANLFNGLSKSTKPTDTPDLEDTINKVNAKFDRTQWLERFMTNYVYSSWKFLTLAASLVFLVLTAVQTYCSAYNCSSPKIR